MVNRTDRFGELFEEWQRRGLGRRRFLRMVAVGTGATTFSALIAACDATSAAKSTSSPNTPTRTSTIATPASQSSIRLPTPMNSSTPTAVSQPTRTSTLNSDGSFVVGLTIDPGDLDPQDASSNSSFSVTKCVYEGLVGFDEKMRIVNELATSWETSGDGGEFTFQIARGVTFHDGQPCNSQAVKDSFDRVLNNPDLGSNAFFLPVIDHVEAHDDGTVKIVAKHPFAAMIAMLAYPAAGIVSPSAAKRFGAGFGMHPVGTGLFKFTNWSIGIELNLERNRNYWNSANGALTPKLRIQGYDQMDALRDAIETGEVHFAAPLHATQAEQLRDVSWIDVQTVPSTSVCWISLNNQKKPFDNREVRLALNFGVNKEEVMKAADLGQGVVMDSVMSQLVGGYHKVGVYDYDPSKAKELLTKAGYPNGFQTKLLASTTNKPRADAVKAQLEKIGVTIDVIEMNPYLLAAELVKPVDQSSIEMLVSEWSPSTGDADWAIRPLYTKDQWPPAGAARSFYSNPDVEKYVQDGLQIGDVAQRDAVYVKAQEVIWDDAPNIFLYAPTYFAASVQGSFGVFIQPDGIVHMRNAGFV